MIYSKRVFWDVIPQVENCASTWRNHISGSAGQKSGSFRLTAATAAGARVASSSVMSIAQLYLLSLGVTTLKSANFLGKSLRILCFTFSVLAFSVGMLIKPPLSAIMYFFPPQGLQCGAVVSNPWNSRRNEVGYS